jgi:hypothetical protein
VPTFVDRGVSRGQRSGSSTVVNSEDDILHKLEVFENRVLRGIFEPKRDEVTGGWRKLHKEEQRDLYSSPRIIKSIKSRWM